MDAWKVAEVHKETKEEFQFGRARLYRVSETKKVAAEIEQDREKLFALFEAQGKEKQLEYLLLYKRLHSNYGKVASYNGIRKGREQVEAQIKEMSDPTSFHILTYLWKHPETENAELARYLDRETLRLSTLAQGRGPLFAPLPTNITKLLRANHVPM